MNQTEPLLPHCAFTFPLLQQDFQSHIFSIIPYLLPNIPSNSKMSTVITKYYFVRAFIMQEGKKLNINRTYSAQGRILKDTELEEWVEYGQTKRRQIFQARQNSISKGRKWQAQYVYQLLRKLCVGRSSR